MTQSFDPFPVADLETTRAGRLSDEQRRRYQGAAGAFLKNEMFGAVACVVIAAILATSTGPAPNAWLRPFAAAGFIAMAVLLPMGLINAWYWPRALRLNRGINNQIEREVDDIESGRVFRFRRHFRLLRRWRVKLSDTESWTWAVTELATIVALVFILIDFTRSPNFSAGAIYAVLAYVYDYLEGLNQVPTVVNNLARLKDVRSRLEDSPK